MREETRQREANAREVLAVRLPVGRATEDSREDAGLLWETYGGREGGTREPPTGVLLAGRAPSRAPSCEREAPGSRLSAAAVCFAEPAEAGRPLEVAVPSPPTALPGAPGSCWDPKSSRPVTLTRKSGLPEAKSVLGKNWFKSRYRRERTSGSGDLDRNPMASESAGAPRWAFSVP